MKKITALSILLVFGVASTIIAGPEEDSTSSDAKTIHFIADGPSHGYGEHDYVSGSMLLRRRLEKQLSGVQARVHPKGWPEDSSVLAGADAIVLFTDGGQKHPVLDHLKQMDRLARNGIGIVSIHWSLKAPKGKAATYFKKWFGAFWEGGYSRNLYWTPSFDELPDHPISRGVSPFDLHDEWYTRLRFREGNKGITPILQEVPPKQSSTDFVAWTAKRDSGGRSFGFTGAHYHKNWAHDQFRRIVLNAIAWTAHIPVPRNGVQSKTPTVKELEAHHNEDGQYNRDKLRKQIRAWNR